MEYSERAFAGQQYAAAMCNMPPKSHTGHSVGVSQKVSETMILSASSMTIKAIR